MRRLTPRQAVTSLEQRAIEGLAVVCHEHVEALKELVDCRQLVGLFVEVAHEELVDAERVFHQDSDADQERIGSCAARDPGGFRIENQIHEKEWLWM